MDNTTGRQRTARLVLDVATAAELMTPGDVAEFRCDGPAVSVCDGINN
jgi:hypothetical protein